MNKRCPALYYERMDAAQNDKAKILQFINDNDRVLDVGGGSGIVSAMILESSQNVTVDAIDTSDTAVERLCVLAQQYPGRLRVVQEDFFDYCAGQYDAIVFCSVLHEMFSYTRYEGKRFNPAIIDASLKRAVELLAPGGRIIVRDGVAPTHNHKVMLQYKDPALRLLAERYEAEFEGFNLNITHTPYGDVMPRNSAMELLYTITWGEASFEREVQEWYGFYSLNDWKQQGQRLMSSDNVCLCYLNKYLQPEYEKHLEGKVVLTTAPKLDWNGSVITRPATFPSSNCIAVFNKI